MICPIREEEMEIRRKRENTEQRRQKVLGVLEEMKVFCSDTMRGWRGVVTEWESTINECPPGGRNQQLQSTTGTDSSPSSLSDTFQCLADDMQKIMGKLEAEILEAEILEAEILEAEILPAPVEVTSSPDETCKETMEPVPHEPVSSGPQQEAEVEPEQCCERLSADNRQQTTDSTVCSSDSGDANETEESQTGIQGRGTDNEDCASTACQKDLLQNAGRQAERTEVKVKEETGREWITVGLTGEMEDGQSNVPDACFIQAPVGAAELLRCEMAEAFSSFMVTGSEELVSRVIRIKVQGQAKFPFPVTVSMPFSARYRGVYRDVVVKIVDGDQRASYVTPVTTEGVCGQKGTFAEVKVYSLGLFAVVSCLKREHYTVPRRGLSLKLPMDTRVCLSYLPGSFTYPVMAQTMIQPLDSVLLATLRSRSDIYYSVVSTSSLLYLTHPNSQLLRRPLTITLPCPPNPEKRRRIRGQGRGRHNQQISPLTPTWDPPASPYPRVRKLGASLMSPEELSDDLVVLCSRDRQWNVLEKVTVRNLQNGLVSFEVMENFDRLLVVRLSSPLQPSHLTSLAEELEESVGCHSVTVVLQRPHSDPHTVLMAALPSRDLSWELSRLRSGSNGGLLETSSHISMCEGDQLLLCFSGNITSTRTLENQNDGLQERITFHAQRTNQLSVRLTEVDTFGNYSSPHYKGTVLFYKVSRGQVEWRGDRPGLKDVRMLQDAVCSLPLTLPKKVRTINRPIAAKVKLCEETDSLSDSLLLWLAGKLSEEEVSWLVLSLRLRRSTTQLVRRRSGASVSTQAFNVLTMWRRGQPAAPHQHKVSQLAQCLTKSGRADLGRELLLRQNAAVRQGSADLKTYS